MNHATTNRSLPSNVREAFFKCKDGVSAFCGDAIAISENYFAVIDGATPKGVRTWDEAKGDVFVANLLKNAVLNLSPNLTAAEAIEQLNTVVSEEYKRAGTSFDALSPEERLQASIVIYSAFRKEIWLFGDCQFRVNGENFTATRRGDILLADLRVLCREMARLESLDNDCDHGREAILPFLKKYVIFANADSEFGYDAINGGAIHAEHVTIRSVKQGDFVVLASDGYPVLFDTLAKT